MLRRREVQVLGRVVEDEARAFEEVLADAAHGEAGLEPLELGAFFRETLGDMDWDPTSKVWVHEFKRV